MQSIEIDFDVFKALTQKRETESVTYNDVLRKLLGLSEHHASAPPTLTAPGDWVVKNVRFPQGTEFQATYKGTRHAGIVRNGKLVVGNTSYDSPSAAACDITGTAVNGWWFWQTKPPGSNDWRWMAAFRK
jgi:hypothetical protein